MRRFWSLASAAIPLIWASHALAMSDMVLADMAQMSRGEVRAINREAGKITVRHGEIRNLGMPPMTMVFGVRDPQLLRGVQKGDAIAFTAEKSGGAFVITALEAAPR